MQWCNGKSTTGLQWCFCSMGQKFSSVDISTEFWHHWSWSDLCVGICKPSPGFTLQQEAPGSWVKTPTENKVDLLGSLKEEGQIMIHSSFCLTFGTINELHGFELELVGWMYLAFWFQWNSSWEKESVLPEAFVHCLQQSQDLRPGSEHEVKMFVPCAFPSLWLLCFYQCVNFTTKTF